MTKDRPLLEIVNEEGTTMLRVRQATRQGYADCILNGALDLSYPQSSTRRGRVIGGGNIANTVTTEGNICIFTKIKQYDSTD